MNKYYVLNQVVTVDESRDGPGYTYNIAVGVYVNVPTIEAIMRDLRKMNINLAHSSIGKITYEKLLAGTITNVYIYQIQLLEKEFDNDTLSTYKIIEHRNGIRKIIAEFNNDPTQSQVESAIFSYFDVDRSCEHQVKYWNLVSELVWCYERYGINYNNDSLSITIDSGE